MTGNKLHYVCHNSAKTNLFTGWFLVFIQQYRKKIQQKQMLEASNPSSNVAKHFTTNNIAMNEFLKLLNGKI